MLCIAVIGIQAMERIDAANALVGSTDSIIKAAEQSMATENPKPEDIKDAGIGEYKYIPVSELSTMNYSDLANWYLTQFPDEEHTNAVAKAEFNIWLVDEILTGTRTQEEFDVALEKAKMQPELDEDTLEDGDVEAPAEGEENAETVAEDTETAEPVEPESTAEQKSVPAS